MRFHGGPVHVVVSAQGKLWEGEAGSRWSFVEFEDHLRSGALTSTHLTLPSFIIAILECTLAQRGLVEGIPWARKHTISSRRLTAVKKQYIQYIPGARKMEARFSGTNRTYATKVRTRIRNRTREKTMSNERVNSRGRGQIKERSAKKQKKCPSNIILTISGGIPGLYSWRILGKRLAGLQAHRLTGRAGQNLRVTTPWL